MRLSECIDNYISENLPYLKQRTVFTYSNKKAALIKAFGDVEIETLTQEAVQEYINRCQKNGETKKALQIRLSLLFCAIKPHRRYDRFKYIVVEKDTEEKRVYSESEVEKIAECINSERKKSQLPILIAIRTGLRLTEICGLKWGDIDFEKRTISIRRNAAKLNGETIISTPKTKSGARTVYITDDLLEMLRQYRKLPEYYVASGKKEPVNQRSIQAANERLLERIGVKSCGMHSYRHAFASKLLKGSTDFKSIANVMGHSNIEVTQNIYNHSTKEREEEVVKLAFGEKQKQEQQKDYEPQIAALRTEINEMRTVIARLAQYVYDHAEKPKEKPQRPLPKGAKYKATDEYGTERYYDKRKTLLADLDVTIEELNRHLNGYATVIDSLGIVVEEL